ncbi:MAG: beta-galactosidase [Myxococcales bacterium]|nr:beta-galactosidase [Myxococcales bacterium]
MEAHQRTRFDDRGLIVAGIAGAAERRLPFYAGAMHYWRVDPKRWASCLAAIHALGLTCVETYVPWRIHEPTRDTFDWRGPNDLPRFLELARAAGLAVVLRPGPHVNAELTAFGFPDHVLEDPAIQARTAHGTPAWLPSPPRAWPLPSYASTAFHARVHAWYAEVARVVSPHLAPEGPVVAIGVDNEAQLFFRTGAYDLDYHPDAITWWQEASGLEGAPPRAWDPADAARCISWLRFKEQYLARALGQFAHALDEVGLGRLARFHNLAPGPLGLSDLRGIQHAIHGPVGLDAYTPRSELPELRRRAIQVASVATPIPIAFEVGIGFFPWFPPLDAGDDPTRERDQLLTLLAGGVRGFNLFMAVERDRYYGAAISKDGVAEPHAKWIPQLCATLADIDWPGLRRATPIALVETRADARFGHATNLANPMPPALAELLGLGPAGAVELGTDPAAIAARRWHAAICAALELAQVPYAILDEAATEDELARYRAVIVPTTTRLDRGLATRLRALAEHKRAIVVIGPGTPTHDELEQPYTEPLPRRIGKIRDGSLADLPGLASDLAALAGELPETWQVERPDAVRAFAYADDAGTARAVFLVNDGAKPATAVVLADERSSLRDPFTGETFRVIGGKVTVPVAGIRLLV